MDTIYQKYKIFEYTNFNPLYGNVFILPKDTLLWRCYNKNFDVISNRPSFFSSRDVALQYNNTSDKACSIFRTTKDLRLIDIRYMKILLNELIKNIEYVNNDTYGIIKSLSIAFGLTSYITQIKLIEERFRDVFTKKKDELNSSDKEFEKSYKNMYKVLNEYNNETDLLKKKNLNPIELEGVRIGETDNDSEVAIYLKNIFDYYCDGYIAPKLFTPYHIPNNYINEELLIFNPLNSGLEITQFNAQDDIKYNSIFNHYVSIQNYNISLSYSSFKFDFFDNSIKLKKGGTKIVNKNSLYYKNFKIDKLSSNKYEELFNLGYDFANNLNITNLLPKSSIIKNTHISSWTNKHKY